MKKLFCLLLLCPPLLAAPGGEDFLNETEMIGALPKTRAIISARFDGGEPDYAVAASSAPARIAERNPSARFLVVGIARGDSAAIDPRLKAFLAAMKDYPARAVIYPAFVNVEEIRVYEEPPAR